MNNTNRKQMMLWLYDSMYKPVSRNIVQRYARRYGKSIGLVYVGGYPKSGTTWISKMIAHYLALPWVGHAYLALGFPAVIHHHWNYHPAFDPSIFVVRDGRDVMVSIYMNLTKGYSEVEESLNNFRIASPGRIVRYNFGRHAVLRRRFHYLFGKKFDPGDVVSNLPRFVEAEMNKPFIPEVRTPWPEYISSWLGNSKRLTLVKYEDMLKQPEATLGSVLQNYLQKELNAEEIAFVVRRFSFERVTGRKPGEENRSAFARKGVAGDWKNCFSKEACQVFDYYAGDMLIGLNYEKERDWVQLENV